MSEAYSRYRSGISPALSSTAAAIPQDQTIQETLNLQALIRSYQVAGHQAASLDPLRMDARPIPVELDPAYYGFTEKDMERE